MYTVAVRRDFVAQHYLVGGDWGPENERHSHHYQVEVQLKGEALDEHGYLVDIVDIEAGLEALVAYFRDRTLNELPEFADTLIPRAPGGRLCADRLRWLDQTLATSRRPTILAQHHPPLVTGLTIMDEMALEDPAAEAAIISRHADVERVICGHYHRNIQARFGGTIASVCPSAAHQLMLILVPGADIRFAFEPSEFHLHFWNGSQVITHTEVVEDFPSWGSRD